MLFLPDNRISYHSLLRLPPAVPEQPAAYRADTMQSISFNNLLTPMRRPDRRTDKRRNPLNGAIA